MSKKERIRNQEVREYVYKYIPEILNRNPIFVKVFGADFAKKRIKSEIYRVYTNENNKYCSGYHSGGERSITICLSGSDSSLLTSNDIANNRDTEEIVLHESIHAILERTKKESIKYGIQSGTGILERYSDSSELGRGLNEGFTEWLCEKCGYTNRTYEELTDYIRLLELALGTEKVMELGKGNIYERFPQILNMEKDDIVELLSLSDNLYEIDLEIKTYSKLKNILKEKIFGLGTIIRNSFGIESNDEESYDDYIDEFEEIMRSPEYKSYLKSKKLEDNEENLLEYIEEKITECKERKEVSIISFESIVLDKYFEKNIEKIMSEENEEIDKDDFDKISKIVSVLNTSTKNIPEKAIQEKDKFSSIKIKEDFEAFKKRYIKQYWKKSAEQYKRGELPLKNFIVYIKELSDDAKSLPRDLAKEFSRNISPEFEAEIYEVLEMSYDFYSYYNNDEVFEKIRNSSILKLVSQDKSIKSSVIYSDDNFYNRYVDNITIGRDDEVDVYKDFDFTDALNGEEYDIIMKNFLELRKKVFEDNPNSKIHIASREIIVDNGNGHEFYHIEKGEFIPMQIEDRLDLQFAPEVKTKSTESLVYIPPKRKNSFAKFIDNMRQKIFEFTNRNSKTQIDYTDEKRNSNWKN